MGRTPCMVMADFEIRAAIPNSIIGKQNHGEAKTRITKKITGSGGTLRYYVFLCQINMRSNCFTHGRTAASRFVMICVRVSKLVGPSPSDVIKNLSA